MPTTTSRTESPRRWALSAPAREGLSRVDADHGVLYGVAVCTEGEAAGHDVRLDASFIDAVVALGNARKAGQKVRFGHPTMSSTALGTFLGRAKNFRRDSGAAGQAIARADLYLSAEAAETPQGDLRDYVLRMAAAEPDMLGLSIVFTPGESYRKAGPDGVVDPDGPVYETIERLHAVDVVDEPAANPDGLFSAWSRETFAGQVSEFLDLHPQVYRLLEQHPEVIDGFLARYRAYRERRGAMDSNPDVAAQLEAALEVEGTDLPDGSEAATSEPPAHEDADDAGPDGPGEPEGAEEVTDEAAGEAVPEQALGAVPAIEDPRQTVKRFLEAFGPDGAAWYAEGLSFEAAKDRHAERLAARVAELEARLAAIPAQLGAGEPVSFSPPSEAPDAAAQKRQARREELRPKLGENLAAFAAGLTFAPGAGPDR